MFRRNVGLLATHPSFVLVLIAIQDREYATVCHQHLWPVFRSLHRLLDGQRW